MQEQIPLTKFEGMTTSIVYEKLVKSGICSIAEWKSICQKIQEILRELKTPINSDTKFSDHNILYVSINKELYHINDEPYGIKIKVFNHFRPTEQFVINVQVSRDEDTGKLFVADIYVRKL